MATVTGDEELGIIGSLNEETTSDVNDSKTCPAFKEASNDIINEVTRDIASNMTLSDSNVDSKVGTKTNRLTKEGDDTLNIDCGELTACSANKTYVDGDSEDINPGKCYGCESSSIVNICETCTISLCEACAKYHIKLHPDHSLTPLPCTGSGEAKQTMCILHTEEPVNKWCTTCSKFMCTSTECTELHNQHKVVDTGKCARPLQQVWTKCFESLLQAIHDIEKRKYLVKTVSKGEPYSSLLLEFERRENAILNAVRNEIQQEKFDLLQRRETSTKTANTFLLEIDNFLRRAKRLRCLMAAAYQDENNVDVEQMVNVLQEFNILFPNIKRVSCSPPVLQPNEWFATSPENFNFLIHEIISYWKIHQMPEEDFGSTLYSGVLPSTKEYTFKETAINEIFLSHVAYVHDDLKRFTVSFASSGSKYLNFVAHCFITKEGLVTLLKTEHSALLDNYYSNIVTLPTVNIEIIHSSEGIHILGELEQVVFTFKTEPFGFANTFISRYSDVSIIALTFDQTKSIFYVINVFTDVMKVKQRFHFDRRLVPQQHFQMFGISDGRVVMTEDGKSLLIVHLELDLIETHDLATALAGALINCVYVDHRLNILVGCSDGKLYLFGKDKKLSLIYTTRRPITSILNYGNTLILALIPNILHIVSFTDHKHRCKSRINVP